MTAVETEAPAVTLVPDPEPEVEPTVEELQARVTELETQLASAGETMIEFRAKVRHEAMDMARAHNLCGVVETTLRKVGIDIQRTRVEVVHTYEQVLAFDVPDDLLAGISEPDFVNWAVNSRHPKGMTNRDMRAITRVPVANRTVGKPQYRVVKVVRPENRRATVESPPGFLAAYASDDGRVCHFIYIGNRTVETRHDGRFIEVRGAAACGSGGSWRATSARGEGRACARCNRAAGVAGPF